ncbi:lysozyme inhibitor LprI family protein [Erwinia sp. HDF1-3R]|uniref:lysozyme inhibitor LprI family protein n=1 Tax=Erwinia sp. HDF1-3R TaxID=3141543 RepID=UPI0031F4C994
MMFRKLALLVAVGVFSNAANAGLFDSNDFKCGRVDAVKALSDYIRNDASGLLQSDFLTKNKYGYDKPVSTYQSALNSIVLNITNVSTDGSRSYGLNCRATISLKIPQETLDVVSNAPGYLRSVTGAYGKINNGSVVWNDVSYNAKLADNNKDIIFSNFSRSDISDVMFNVSVLAENKERIVKALSQSSLGQAQSNYKNADRELNALWKELPDSARNALKNEQLTWINDKVKKCGKISDASSETMDVSQRTGIYQCQAKMTNERISYLSGNNN